MARDERRRQKKLEKKRLKRREASSHRNLGSSVGLPSDPAVLAALPVLEGWLSSRVFETGMGSAVIARTLAPGRVLVGTFLLDLHCLGIKDAFGNVMPISEFRELVRKLDEQTPLVEKKPEYVTKLILDLEAWAQSIGFAPHADYQVAKRALVGIPAQQCSEQFVFGEDGKPCYVQGPFDRPFRVQRITETLLRTCGMGNFKIVQVLETPDDLHDDIDMIEDDIE